MKKVMYLVILMSVLMIFGCGKATVEDVAKDYVKKQFSSDNTVKFDTSKLQYAVKEEEGNKATVTVTGTIDYEGQIFLIREDREWKIDEERVAQSEPDLVH